MPQHNLTDSPPAHYVYALDLGADPFETEFQTNFFYPGGDRHRILEQLVHYARFSQQPLLLNSECGSGKSSLIKALVEQLQPVMECCQISVENLNDRESILAALAERLALKLDAERSLSSFIEALRFTLGVGEEPEPILIIVNRVDLLTVDELEFLLDIQRESRGGVHMLWVSEHINAALDVMVGEGAEGLKCLELSPLSAQETAEYLLQCLQQVGYAGEMPLNTKALAELHRQAKGNFEQIRRLVSNFLLSQNAESSKKPSFALPITHVVAVTILATALVVAFLYKGDTAEVANGAVQPVIALDGEMKRAGELEIQEKQKIASFTDPDTDGVQRQEPEDPREVISSVQIATTSELTVVDALDQADDEVSAEPPIPVVEKSIDSTLMSEKTSPSSAEQEIAVAQAPFKAEAKIIPREQRLLDMPNQSYMLQLLGSRSEQSAKDFIKKYRTKVPLTYFKASLKSKPWFVVLAGPYDNRASALKSIKALPKSLQKQKPWARSLASIQTDIQKKNP